MRSRLVLLLAIAVAAVGVVLAVARVASRPAGPPVARASLAPSLASYLGVYEAGAPRAYQPFATFAKAAGRQPNILGYYSGWPQPFDASFAATARRHGAATIVQIDPTHALVPANRRR